MWGKCCLLGLTSPRWIHLQIVTHLSTVRDIYDSSLRLQFTSPVRFCERCDVMWWWKLTERITQWSVKWWFIDKLITVNFIGMNVFLVSIPHHVNICANTMIRLNQKETQIWNRNKPFCFTCSFVQLLSSLSWIHNSPFIQDKSLLFMDCSCGVQCLMVMTVRKAFLYIKAASDRQWA